MEPGQERVDAREALLRRAVAVLEADDRVLAAWLVGSLAGAHADRYSDIDLHCLIADSAADELRHGWLRLVHEFTPMVLAAGFGPGTIGGYCITPDWLHIDLALHPEAHDPIAALVGLRPLFDRTGRLPASRPVAPPGGMGAPYFPAAVVDWFFYMLGNLVVVVGRDEPVLGTAGAIAVRDTCLVPLFYAERGVTRDGGSKRLRPLLSPEQHELLEALPPLQATLESVIVLYRELTRMFIARGRTLANAVGANWPSDLETATLAHLERELGEPFV